MSRRRVYKEETIAIISRFFEAVDYLIEVKTIRGIKTYCDLYDINRRHYYTQKEDMNKGYFEIQWILPLIKEFKVSSNWLLFGKGKMLK